jgi:hypothetical protein
VRHIAQKQANGVAKPEAQLKSNLSTIQFTQDGRFL